MWGSYFLARQLYLIHELEGSFCKETFTQFIQGAKYITHCGYSIENNIASDIRLSRNVWSTGDLRDHNVCFGQ